MKGRVLRVRLTVVVSQVKVPLVQAIAESHPPNREQVIQSRHVGPARVGHPPLSARGGTKQ